MKKLIPYLLGAGTIVGGWILVARLYSGPNAEVAPPVVRQPFDSASIDRTLKVNEAAVKTDPYGALGWSMLASSSLARSRESDDSTMAVQAEQAALKSLALRTLGNAGAWNKLISSLLQQHRFLDALSECEKAEKSGTFSDDTYLQHADCLIEVGRYDEAGVLVAKHPRAFSNASGWAVMARLLEINGKPEQGIDLLKQGTAQIEANFGASSDTVAWFHTRLAQAYQRNGKHADAKREFEAALSLYPRDYKAMAGLAKLASQSQQWSEAIAWGQKSDAIAQMADVKALIGDAYAMRGDHANASLQYDAVASLVGRPSGSSDGLHEAAPMAGAHGHRLDRQYAIYCADHEKDPDGAYAAALRDMESRKDIYAYDTLAWVNLKRGRKEDAAKAIEYALARQTKDSMVLYHAGQIHLEMGDRQRAAACLREALTIDPHFDGIAAPRAQRQLENLSKDSGVMKAVLPISATKENHK